MLHTVGLLIDRTGQNYFLKAFRRAGCFDYVGGRRAQEHPRKSGLFHIFRFHPSYLRGSPQLRTHRFPPIEGLPGGVKTKDQSNRSRYHKVGTRKTNQEQIGDFGIACEKEEV